MPADSESLNTLPQSPTLESVRPHISWRATLPPTDVVSKILRLSLVGFFINCQPSEPYLTYYLEEEKHLSSHTLDTEVWPIELYTQAAAELPVGILAETVGFIPTILLGLLCRLATRIILIFTHGKTWMQATQVTYAVATACNSIFFAYGFLVVPPQYYMFATGCMYAMYHCGNMIGSIISEVIHEFNKDLYILFWTSLCFTFSGIVVFFWIPTPRRGSPDSLYKSIKEQPHMWKRTLRDLVQMYNDRHVLAWSLWWFLAHSSIQLMLNYYQIQFTDIQKRVYPNSNNKTGGNTFGWAEVALEASMVCGALLTPVLFPFVRAHTLISIIVPSLCIAGIWVASTFIKTSLILSYTANSAAFFFDTLQLSTASAVIAATAKNARYGVLFPVNTFLMNVVATVVQVTGQVLSFEANDYYLVGSGLQLTVIVSIIIFYLVYYYFVGSSPNPEPNQNPPPSSPSDDDEENAPLMDLFGRHAYSVNRGLK